jgi:hypothetical protein
MFPVPVTYRYFAVFNFVEILLIKYVIIPGRPPLVTCCDVGYSGVPVSGSSPGPRGGQQEDAGCVAPASWRGLMVSENILN